MDQVESRLGEFPYQQHSRVNRICDCVLFSELHTQRPQQRRLIDREYSLYIESLGFRSEKRSKSYVCFLTSHEIQRSTTCLNSALWGCTTFNKAPVLSQVYDITTIIAPLSVVQAIHMNGTSLLRKTCETRFVQNNTSSGFHQRTMIQSID